MSQKTNKIIVLVGVIGLTLLLLYLIFITKIPKKTVVPLKEVDYILVFKGQDPENGSLLSEKLVPVSGLEVELKEVTKDGQVSLEKKISDSSGEVSFGIKGGISYLVYLKPESSLSNLYVLNNPLQIYLPDIHEGEMRQEYLLKLKEEAKRDVERKNHLIIYEEALRKLKELKFRYPAGIGIPIAPQSSIVNELIKYKLIDKPLIDPKEPARITDPNDPQKVILEPNYYRYYSDRDRYLIIAYPEIDFRQRTELPFVGNYENKVIYWIGDLSLLNQ